MATGKSFFRHLPHNCEACAACKTFGRSARSDLIPQEIKMLESCKVPHFYPQGSILFSPGFECSGLFCIASGTVLVERITESGTRGVSLAEAQDIVGWMDFFRGGSYSSRAIAQTDTVACHIPGKAVEQLIQHNPRFAIRFLAYAAGEKNREDQSTLDQRFASARQRLARTLMMLRWRHGTVDDSGQISIDLPLSRRDLADLVEVRPETLSRAIHQFEDAGIAFFSGRTVRIADLDRMLDEVEHPENEAAASA